MKLPLIGVYTGVYLVICYLIAKAGQKRKIGYFGSFLYVFF